MYKNIKTIIFFRTVKKKSAGCSGNPSTREVDVGESRVQGQPDSRKGKKCFVLWVPSSQKAQGSQLQPSTVGIASGLHCRRAAGHLRMRIWGGSERWGFALSWMLPAGGYFCGLVSVTPILKVGRMGLG